MSFALRYYTLALPVKLFNDRLQSTARLEMNRTALILLGVMALSAMTYAVPAEEEKAPASNFAPQMLARLSRNVLEELSRSRRRTSTTGSESTTTDETTEESTEDSTEACSGLELTAQLALGVADVTECAETAVDDIVGGDPDDLAANIIAIVTCVFTALGNFLLALDALDCSVAGITLG